MSESWCEQVVCGLRTHRVYRELGFGEEDLRWYPAGADRAPLIQLARDPGWRMPATDAAGFEEVWVHFESCRPGHLALHCEFFPRLSKAAKAEVDEEMRGFKRKLTELLREVGREQDWPGRFGAHLMRTREDAGDPSSLIVWTFELGLGGECEPRAFMEAAARVIEGVTPGVDVVMGCGSP